MKTHTFILLLFYSVINFSQTYQPDEFVTTWKTDNVGSSNDTSITIPAPNPGNDISDYNYEVDWDNDGTFEETGITGPITHDFGTAGTYTIRIRGTYPIIRFNNTGDKLKIIDVVQWGNNSWESMFQAFYGCQNLTISANDVPDLSNVTNMNSMFRYAYKFNSNINNWNVSNVVNMQGLFFEAKIYNQPLNNWNTANVTNMYQMFNKAYTFNSSIFLNVTNVTNMGHMFRDARKFNQDISSWDVSNVTSMYFMFTNAFEFNQNIGSWTTNNLTLLNNIFSGAKVFNQNINSWNVSGLTSLNGVFNGALVFNQPLNNWDVSNVTSMIGTFKNARKFNQDISTPNWDVSKVTDMKDIFFNAYDFEQNLGSWDVSKVTRMINMFKGVSLETVNYDALLIGWNAQSLQSNVTFHGGNSKYCMGKDAWNNMINTDNWSIIDSGYGCDDCSGKVLTWDGTNFTDGTNIVAPDDLTPVTLTANYDTSANGGFSSCNCTIDNGVTLIIKDSDFASVTKDLVNNGNIIVENNGSFIQTSANATISGSGSYKVHRTTTPYTEYDYTYWSSPVVNETVENAFQANSTLSAGTSENSNNATPNGRIYWFNTANFNDSDDDYYDDEQDAWTVATGVMTPAKGYIAMGAGADFPFNTTFSSGLEQSVFFEGEFNNAEISIPVVGDNDSGDNSINENLIGNPYPSAIDIKKLMLKNSAVLSGTFRFWTHDSPISGSNPGPNAYDFTNADYAMATTDGTSFNAISGGTDGTAAPEFIASCQGFIVEVDNPGSNLIFNNEMRVKDSNDSFRRTTNISNENKFHLNLTGNNGLFRQILIGFNESASNEVDKLDGVRNLISETNFYSKINNSDDKFAIQLLNEFDQSKIVPLGLDIVNTGNYEISIASVEGIFSTNQTIYIEDLGTNTIHNLSDSNYNFFIEEGFDIENRLLIRFTNSVLSLDENTVFKPVIYPNPSTGIFNISINTNEEVEIKIFDIIGKEIFYKKNNTTTIDLSNMEKGVYFIEIFNGKNKVTKKLIMK